MWGHAGVRGQGPTCPCGAPLIAAPPLLCGGSFDAAATCRWRRTPRRCCSSRTSRRPRRRPRHRRRRAIQAAVPTRTGYICFAPPAARCACRSWVRMMWGWCHHAWAESWEASASTFARAQSNSRAAACPSKAWRVEELLRLLLATVAEEHNLSRDLEGPVADLRWLPSVGPRLTLRCGARPQRRRRVQSVGPRSIVKTVALRPRRAVRRRALQAVVHGCRVTRNDNPLHHHQNIWVRS